MVRTLPYTGLSDGHSPFRLTRDPLVKLYVIAVKMQTSYVNMASSVSGLINSQVVLVLMK